MGLPFVAIVLAAGQGTRMKSARPKVLFPVAGRPMVHYVVEAALAAGARYVVAVVGHGREEVGASLTEAFGERVRIAVQEEQRGTGHAVSCALPAIDDDASACLVLCGDTPLVTPSQLAHLRDALGDAPLAVLTMRPERPKGYGRILRGANGRVLGIREERDASAEERHIGEVNSGLYFVRLPFLRASVAALRAENAQNELYLTDIVATAANGDGAASLLAEDAVSLSGVNDRSDLARAEDALFARIADAHRLAGATVRTGARIDWGVRVEADAVIEHGVVLRGATHIGGGAIVDVGSVLTDVVVAAGAHLKPYTIATSSHIGERAQIGPFSHLRAASHIEEDAHVGNFVETKKTTLRRGAKANHLAYLGDGDVGEGANIGAGTIFCNYDGYRKHRTEIGPGAFIGSDSQLIAPVRIGANAYVATGTTVTRDVPDEALAIARVKQENKEGYAPRLRSRLGAAAKKQG